MKTSIRFILSLILTLGLITPTLQAQDNATLQKIKLFPKQFAAFSANYPQEKVYLHIDNTAYYLDETIWFKAYVVRADQNSLSPVSKILYVELISPEGYVVDSKKLKVENGQCHGNFNPLSSNFAGFYEIRAYTSYMLNFGEKNYFSRVLPLYDKPKKPGEYIPPQMTDRLNSLRIPDIRNEYTQKEQVQVTFFPEGGNIISGLSSRVAFKATGKKGENLVVSGAVYNEKEEKAADFRTEYLGMGSFEFTPVSGKYFARVQYKNKEYKFELPAVLPRGYVMRVDNSADEKINVTIQKSSTTSDETLGLCISSRGLVYFEEVINTAGKNTFDLSFPKKKLPSGVTQITLYNTAGEIVSERLAFVNHHSEMKIDLTQNQTSYKPFEKVDMSFQLKDQEDNPVETSFSVSVRDATTSSTNPFSDNILTNLLLSSELSGYIENPDYYFQSDDNVRRHELDLLLLTQGWRRYSWKQMTGQSAFSLKYPVEKELVINGTVTSLLAKNKLKDVDITMLLGTSDSLPQLGKCKTDSAGNFNFILRDFKGEGKLTMQSRQDGKRKEMIIKLNRDFSPELKTYSFAELNIPQYFNTLASPVNVSELTTNKNDTAKKLSPTEYSKLPMDKKVILLTEVTVKDKRKPIKVSVKYDVAKELDKRKDAGEWIPSSVNTFLYFTSNYYNASTGMYKGKWVMFVREDVVAETNLDAPSSNGSEMDKVPGVSTLSGGEMPYLDEVESISFIEDHGSILRIGNGLIDPSSYVIALIRCKTNYRKEPYGIRDTSFRGFSYVKEFYNPQYDKMVLPDEKDYRRTLYWNPNVLTDKDGRANVSFYNNGSCKVMNVNAETVTSSGIIGVIHK